MFFFSMSALVEKLGHKRLAARESRQYLFGFLALQALSSLLNGTSPSPERPFWGVLAATAIGFLIAAGVLMWLYDANGGDEGDDFLQNLLATSFVASCRYLVVVIPLMIIFSLGGSAIAKLAAAEAGAVPPSGPPAAVLVATLLVVVVALAGLVISLVTVAKALRQIRAHRHDGEIILAPGAGPSTLPS